MVVYLLWIRSQNKICGSWITIQLLLSLFMQVIHMQVHIMWNVGSPNTMNHYGLVPLRYKHLYIQFKVRDSFPVVGRMTLMCKDSFHQTGPKWKPKLSYFSRQHLPFSPAVFFSTLTSAKTLESYHLNLFWLRAFSPELLRCEVWSVKLNENKIVLQTDLCRKICETSVTTWWCFSRLSCPNWTWLVSVLRPPT